MTSVMGEPSAGGRFGEFGGRFIPETLVPACAELEAAFRTAWADPGFRGELDALLRDYAGRPSLLTDAKAEFKVPVVAIGGITQATTPQLIAAGADSVAVITALFGAPDVTQAAREFCALFGDR